MMKWRAHLIFLALLAVIGSGCVSPVKGLFPPVAGAPHKTIHIVSHGFHTGVIVSRADIPTNTWPAQKDFGGYDFLEVGWGDDDFYRAEKVTTRITLKAVFLPTSSVLHVVGFNGSPRENFPESKIIKVELSERGLARMCGFIDAAYTRDSNGNVIPLGSGLYGVSEFYQANGSYYFPRTCNYWIAAALRSAGCPTAPAISPSATCLMWQVKQFGQQIR